MLDAGEVGGEGNEPMSNADPVADAVAEPKVKGEKSESDDPLVRDGESEYADAEVEVDAVEGQCARGGGVGEIERGVSCVRLGLREQPKDGEGQWKGKMGGKRIGVGVSGRAVGRGVDGGEGAKAGKGRPLNDGGDDGEMCVDGRS